MSHLVTILNKIKNVEGVEFLNLEYLLHKIELNEPIKAYCGYETSGTPHWGSAISFLILNKLAELGIKCTILCADVHAELNKKQIIKEELELTFKKFFPNSKLEYKYGSDFQYSKSYWQRLLTISSKLTLTKISKSTMIDARNNKLYLSDLLYSTMQAADIDELDIDLAIGGTDQRKIHMLHNDKFRKISYLHIPLLLKNGEKISKSKGNLVYLSDPVEKVKEVIDDTTKNILEILYEQPIDIIIENVRTGSL